MVKFIIALNNLGQRFTVLVIAHGLCWWYSLRQVPHLLKRNFFSELLKLIFVVFDSIAGAFTRKSNNETMFFNTFSMQNIIFLETITVGSLGALV